MKKGFISVLFHNGWFANGTIKWRDNQPNLDLHIVSFNQYQFDDSFFIPKKVFDIGVWYE